MPPFDQPQEQPDGQIVVVDEPDFAAVCFLEDFYRGSFSAPGKDEAVLALAACGADRVNDIAPGSVVLASREASSGWTVKAVQPNTNARGCSLAKRPDRTLLICADGFGAFGDGSLSWRFTLDFSRPESQRVQVFSKLFQSPSSSCMLGGELLAERGVADVEIVSEKLEDVDRDGDDDLTVVIARAAVPPSPAIAKQHEALCKKKPDASPQAKELVGKPRRFTLEFRGEPTGLRATDATKKLLDAWGAEAPEFWWNVVAW